jgi:hypothetical protein
LQRNTLAVFGVVAVLLTGCGSQTAPASATSPKPSPSATVTEDPAITAMVKAAADTIATRKAEEKATAEKKAADDEAAKKAAAAAAAKPRVYTGFGDDVVKIAKHDSTAEALTITHQGARNFIVESLDSSLKDIDLLVNTIGNYSGTVVMDANSYNRVQTDSLKITAGGAWTITLTPLQAIKSFDGSAQIEGVGDDVFYYKGKTTSALFAHTGSRNIVVQSYGSRGDLLVNEIGVYSGRVVWAEGLYQVTADGNWSATFTK